MKYAATRHNIGWRVVDRLSQKIGRRFRKTGFEFWAAEGPLAASKVILVKTWTYVNGTGRVVPELKDRYGDLGGNFLVVCDDVALPLGSLRIRKKGSSGGHHGVQSIIEALGDGFPRMRLGVGGGKPDPDYVLGEFTRSEEPHVGGLVAVAAEAAEYWIQMGIEKCMTRYNRRVEELKE